MLRVRVLVSFNGLVKGDTATVTGKEAETLARAYAGIGLLEVTGDGTDQSGPGADAPGDPGSEPDGAGEHGTPGGEPGEDPVSG